MSEDTSLGQFGDRVRQIREARGFTQAALAEVIGKARSSIANMEAGRQQPTLPALVTLARALGVSAGVLLGEEPVPPLPRIANVVIDIAFTARCSICGPLGQWQDRAEAEQARKEHNVPHPPAARSRHRDLGTSPACHQGSPMRVADVRSRLPGPQHDSW